MKKTRYIEEQIAFALKQAETGTRVGKTCINMGGGPFYSYGLPTFCKFCVLSPMADCYSPIKQQHRI
ncbi:TPA: hypothetical protein ACWZ8A_002138 [Klebsiella pneumoniae]